MSSARPFLHALPSPIATLRLLATDDALVGVYLEGHGDQVPPVADGPPGDAAQAIFDAAARWLDSYFAGQDRTPDVPLAAHGTAFQEAVWAELARIPWATTITYAALAARIGRPGASRAVGAANARNPLSLLVPCHRVVGAGGALTGYAGGLDAKRWLVEHEAHFAASDARG